MSPGAALNLPTPQHAQHLETEEYVPSMTTVIREANTGAVIERHAGRLAGDRATVGADLTARTTPIVANRRHKWRGAEERARV